MEAILFYIFAIGVLGAGAQVIFRRNPLYGALSLAPEGSYGGILKGDCRRSPPPPGAPAG